VVTVAPELGATAGGFCDWGAGPDFICAGVAGTLLFAVEPAGVACKGWVARAPALLCAVEVLLAITGAVLFAADCTGCTVLAPADDGAGVVAGCAAFGWGLGVEACF